VILIDANIFMYAAGAEHPHKEPSRRFLEQVARGEVDAALDAEVLQEILHWYRAIKRWSEGRSVYDLARRRRSDDHVVMVRQRVERHKVDRIEPLGSAEDAGGRLRH
jgi:predicted nucleic acid-binding protein